MANIFAKRNMKKIMDAVKGKVYCRLRHLSLKEASRQQGLDALRKQLEEAVPDITHQYSMFKVDNDYLRIKVRNLHAFQLKLVASAISSFKEIVIVDIGDSAGTHLQYIQNLYAGQRRIKCLSVNIDSAAIKRIKAKGLDAVQTRAEELNRYNIYPDLILCFEIIEHLTDPVRFLRLLAKETSAKLAIITVPYLRNSRVGLYHIRDNRVEPYCAENTHFFELCPKDWKLVIQQSGWAIVEERVYLQYPPKGMLSLTKPLWRQFDFEGFYGVVLKKDPQWSSLYSDW